MMTAPDHGPGRKPISGRMWVFHRDPERVSLGTGSHVSACSWPGGDTYRERPVDVAQNSSERKCRVD